MVSAPGTAVATGEGMLRITTEHQGGTVVLRLEGRLRGPWVDALRESWQRVREADGHAKIELQLVDVPLVDAPGKTLLGQMHDAGVEIVAYGALTKAICDEIVAAGRR